MITTLDRMFLISYFRSYAIVASCLLSLYVVIDLFTNIDSFGRTGGGFIGMVTHAATYYTYQLALIFDRLAEGITLLSAMFTVAWLQRNNELLPQLSAGIPTRRVIRPILLGVAITLTFGPLNTEFVIPRIATQLMISKDDPTGERAQVLLGAYDPSGVHIEGMIGFRKEQKVVNFYATFPESALSGMIHLSAKEAVYVPPGEGEFSGGWMLTRASPETIEGRPMPANLTMIDPGRYFLKTEDVDYDMVTRGATWFQFAPTTKLKELLDRPEPRRQAKVAVLFHMRLTRPLRDSILVLLGLSVILWNPNRHMFISAGLCICFTVGFFLCVLGCKFLGDNAYVSAPLAAWLPVLVFGPLTLVSFDSIHT